jgi:hypothetical protein
MGDKIQALVENSKVHGPLMLNKKKRYIPETYVSGVSLHSFQPIDIHVVGVLEVLVKDAHLQVLLANPSVLFPDP